MTNDWITEIEALRSKIKAMETENEELKARNLLRKLFLA